MCACRQIIILVPNFYFNKVVNLCFRCELWAKYIFPDRDPSLELQHSLHTEHRMLCQNHFNSDDFTDGSKRLLQRNAVPTDAIKRVIIFPSQRVLMDISNDPNIAASATEPVASTSVRTVQPVAEKENILFAKCSKYMRLTCQLQNRIKNLKRKAMLKAITDEECVKKLSEKVTPTFAFIIAKSNKKL